MEEEEVKSAFEIAMERISRLPELTPEEIAAQKEKECVPVALALTNRFLEGAILESELVSELRNHPEDQVPTVRRILVRNLCRSIQLEGKEKSMKALNGIREILTQGSGFPETVLQDLEQVLAGYAGEKAKEFDRVQALELENLKGFGISGTAVRPNVTESAAWQQALHKIGESFEPRLDSIRQVFFSIANRQS